VENVATIPARRAVGKKSVAGGCTQESDAPPVRGDTGGRFEDKLVQDAVSEVIQAVYEQDFLACSFGFRPKRSDHDVELPLHNPARPR